MASGTYWHTGLDEESDGTGEEVMGMTEKVMDKGEGGDRSSPLRWWETVWAPVSVIIIGGIITPGALLWRQEPVTSAELARMTAEVATLKGEMGAVQRTQAEHAADLRSNREQLGALREALQEIKTFNSGTMREMQNLNIQFAELRGSLDDKQERNKKK